MKDKEGRSVTFFAPPEKGWVSNEKAEPKVREDGYYWVKFITQEWEIAFYFKLKQFWLLPGTLKEYSDDFFSGIDERRIERKEV